MTNPTENHHRGSSLTGVIIAMFILCLVAIVFHSTLVTQVHSTATAQDISKASALGNDVLETMRQTPYDVIISSCDTVENKYCRSWTVSEQVNRKKIDVVVEWPVATKRHSVSFSTIISDQ